LRICGKKALESSEKNRSREKVGKWEKKERREQGGGGGGEGRNLMQDTAARREGLRAERLDNKNKGLKGSLLLNRLSGLNRT